MGDLDAGVGFYEPEVHLLKCYLLPRLNKFVFFCALHLCISEQESFNHSWGILKYYLSSFIHWLLSSNEYKSMSSEKNLYSKNKDVRGLWKKN